MIREWEEGENAFQYKEINGKIKVLIWKGCGICASIPEEINGAKSGCNFCWFVIE